MGLRGVTALLHLGLGPRRCPIADCQLWAGIEVFEVIRLRRVRKPESGWMGLNYEGGERVQMDFERKEILAGQRGWEIGRVSWSLLGFEELQVC